MRIFVTGAAGFVGSAVSEDLIKAGHQVLGLARSNANAAKLSGLGAQVHRGSLDDLESLKSGANEADAVIHCAFVHDFSNFLESCKKEGRAIEAMGEALKGTKKPIIITSGTGLLASTATENDPAPQGHSPRIVSEDGAAKLVEQGINASVMRLPPTVHDVGDHGFIRVVCDLARSKNESPYVGDGQACWGAVHRSDAARLYRLAIEKPTPGTRIHAVGEARILFKDIATKVGQRLGVPVVSKTLEAAKEHFGWLIMAVGNDNRVDSKLTRERFGWKPTGKTLMQDLEGESYFTQH